MQRKSLSPHRRFLASPSPRFALAPAALLALVVTLAGCSRQNALAPEMTKALSGDGASAALAAAPLALDAPIHLVGETGPGTTYSIDVPQAWNGDLVVYLHGYTDPAAPVALPANGPMRDAFLARGFAVVASSFSENGYAVKEGMIQSHQLSGLFTSRVAKPNRTFLFGTSMGGLIGLLLSEKYPDVYAGSLLVSGVVGGSDDEVQYMGDIRVLFDVFYPGVLQGDLEHPAPITNVNAQVIGPVVAAVSANPQGLGLIQMLARKPLPGNNGQELVASLVNVLVFAQQGGGDLYDRAHGHTYFDNADWRYGAPGLPPALLDDVNTRVARYARTPDAANYLAHYGEPSGDLRIPVVLMHTTRDPVVPFWHEGLYGQVGAGPNLLQRQTNRFGHVAFSVAEMAAGFDDLVGWVNTQTKPAL